MTSFVALASTAAFSASPDIPSVIDSDSASEAGAYASLDQERALFAPLNEVPPTYQDYIATQIQTQGIFATPSVSEVTIADRFATGTGATVGFFGADGTTGPLVISGDRRGNDAVASLISALQSLGLVIDATTDTGNPAPGPSVIDNGDATATSFTTTYDGGTAATTPSAIYDGGNA